jgi:hypothetical protein
MVKKENPKKENPVKPTLLDYSDGNELRHRRIDPSDATSYLTISGKSLPKYISR